MSEGVYGSKHAVIKRVASVILSAVLAATGAGLLPQTVMTVSAAGEKTITGLGIGAIADPTPGAGGWSYVYYSHGQNSVKYRFDVQTTDFSRNTMRLDGEGVNPTISLELSNVIFSSLISGTSGNPGAEYKLTIKDTSMSVAVTGGSSITRSGTTITVPYTIGGTNAGNATQVSVVITDSAWNLGTPVTSGYIYLKLTVDTFGTTGTGIFTLPAAYADQTCGTDYYAYIVAEEVNTGNAKDRASVPVSVTIPATSGSSISGPTNVPTVTASSEPEPPVNDMQEVEDKISEAIALGGTRVVRIEGYSALSYHVLEMLQENPDVTLVSEFSYDGLDYKITIPGSAIELDPSIKWYGPKYLFPMFWSYGTDTLPAVQAYLDLYEKPAS